MSSSHRTIFLEQLAFSAAILKFRASTQTIPEDVTEKLAWWAANSVRLPHWASLVKKLLVIQPISASAERVFSLLNNAFNDQQDNALEEYLEASVMIRYNNAKRQ